YELEGDIQAAGTHYSRARSRLTPRLNVPLVSKFRSGNTEVEARNPVHQSLLDANLKGGKALGDIARKLRINLSIIRNPKNTTNQHEEACREIGELFGFETARPDNVFKKGPDVVWSSQASSFLMAF